eukprot:IDg22820t1
MSARFARCALGRWSGLRKMGGIETGGSEGNANSGGLQWRLKAVLCMVPTGRFRDLLDA